MPRISVCLPNLNNLRFLPERLSSIFAQTSANWELVVVDGYSDDGAWEFLVERAQAEPRMRVVQAPREGIYPAMNRCIELAQGDFIYIATSDDTMPPNCLEQLLAALDKHPECDMAHAPLRVLDEEGAELDFAWASVSVFARSSEGLLNQSHIRLAPYNGILHLGGETVFNSLTQLLVRKAAFARAGLFYSNWGSMSDFNWGMRAGLLLNSVHVPGTWGGWRVHSAQATSLHLPGDGPHRERIEEMIEHAIVTTRPMLDRKTNDLVKRHRSYFWQRWNFDQLRKQQKGPAGRLRLLTTTLVVRPILALNYIVRRLRGVHGWQLPPVEVVADWIRQTGRTPIVVVTEEEHTGS